MQTAASGTSPYTENPPPKTNPLPGEDHRTERPVSVKAPIPSKNFSRNVKIISTLATVTVVSALFYYCLKSNETNYIQRVKECMKGFNIPGCKNGVYCPDQDPTFVFKPGGITLKCVNAIDSVIFEGSKRGMQTDLNKYLESRNIFEKIYDAVYDKIFLWGGIQNNTFRCISVA